jgi:catechol 2,3-dioxygenase-like lactoylglutathione lyase family enzyme
MKLYSLWMILPLSACAATQPLPIEGIAHVGYRVLDLEKTGAFYTGILGLPRAFNTTDGAAYFQVNADQYVEFQGGRAPSEDTRLTHIALQTTDIQALRRLLKARGVNAPSPAHDFFGNLSFSIKAPEGTRLDFVQYLIPGRELHAASLSRHLQHTGVIVKREQVEAVFHFYHDVLGFQEFWRWEPKPGDLRLIKLLVTGKRRDIIEMMIYSGNLTGANIGSMHHINFEVPDIHAAHRFVLAHGAKLPANFRPRVNPEDIWAFNLVDPDGTRIEVQDLTKIPPATITEEVFQGRHAWVLSNGWMRVSLLAGGGHIAEARLLSGDPKRDVNPMRVPHYQTIEPYLYDPARDAAVFGTDTHARLSAGYMGHLLCFPMYGPPSPEEAGAGLGNHGEAVTVEWKKIKSEVDTDGVTLWYGADLPRTQYRVERAVHLPRGLRMAHVEEWVENLTPSDRPINWMEHATLGPPFAEPGKTLLDASATRGLVAADPTNTSSLKPDSPVQWPQGTSADNKPVDLRVFQPKDHAGVYYALRLDPARVEQFFTLYHPDYRVLLGYIFPSEGNPWLADWQENRRSEFPPWNGQVIARGLEFGSSPFAEGLRKSVERGTLFDTPAYRWIGGRQKLKTEFTIVLSEIPTDFKGVEELYTEHGVPVWKAK